LSLFEPFTRNSSRTTSTPFSAGSFAGADEAISIYVEKVVFGIYHLSQGKAAMEETTAA
jgi:hypothetical protein